MQGNPAQSLQQHRRDLPGLRLLPHRFQSRGSGLEEVHKRQAKLGLIVQGHIDTETSIDIDIDTGIDHN
jgi:hypothetical protein